MKQLPFFPTDPSFKYRFELEQEIFTLDFSWRDRTASWYVDIYDGDDVLIEAGKALRLGVPVFMRNRDRRLPAGDFLPIDTTGTLSSIGRYDMSDKVQLIYIESTDLSDAITTIDVEIVINE